MISLSLIAANQGNLADAVIKAAEIGADRLHFDVEDGAFSPRFGLSVRTVSDLRKLTGLPFEAHLMTYEPERHLNSFIEAGCYRIYLHVETTQYLRRSLELIRNSSGSPGVAINPLSSISNIDFALDIIDAILLLTSEPDYSGEAFIPAMVEKIRQTRDLIGGKNIELIIDGGVKPESIPELLRLGATGFVIGRAIWDSLDPAVAMALIKKGFLL
jgi:ribulose-phosphate 3-epimerase